MLHHASGMRLTPCGLHDSLSALRAVRSTVCLSLPHATLGTGGWLTRQGLSPCKTPSFAWRTNDEISGGGDPLRLSTEPKPGLMKISQTELPTVIPFLFRLFFLI